jgi:hypothetical protein
VVSHVRFKVLTAARMKMARVLGYGDHPDGGGSTHL